MKYLVSLSGGKDSTACLLWALETLPKDDIIPYYIDTKWEHESVYKYLDYLEDKLDIKIKRIESEGMVELSKRKRAMPNTQMRFCSEELKIKVSIHFFYENFVSKGIDFINVTGIRREESKSRKDTECFKIVNEAYNKNKFIVKVLHPVAYWNTQRVFDYHKKFNIDVNPLYKKGFSRVGCYPCIYARKHELQMMEPEYKQRLRNLEKDMSDLLGKNVKFFPPKKDKNLRETFDFGEEYESQCVNQYGICG